MAEVSEQSVQLPVRSQTQTELPSTSMFHKISETFDCYDGKPD